MIFIYDKSSDSIVNNDVQAFENDTFDHSDDLLSSDVCVDPALFSIIHHSASYSIYVVLSAVSHDGNTDVIAHTNTQLAVTWNGKFH